jgi:serine/threonine-protein phosphatase 2A regulatory subunit A
MDLNPLDLLKEDLSSDETYIKVNSIHRLRLIATVLGSDTVKSQLLPVLSSKAK